MQKEQTIDIVVTFGSIHKHEIDGLVFDKDCVALIECKDWEEGRARAFETFGNQFSTTYPIDGYYWKEVDVKRNFPRGYIRVPQKITED